MGGQTMLTFDPHVPTSSDSENEEESNEEEGLYIVCRHALGREYHRANELTLRRAKPSAQNDAETAAIGSPAWYLCISNLIETECDEY